jgi:hypothetical protein
MASITVFIWTIDLFFLFEKKFDEIISTPDTEITSTSGIYKTPTVFSTISPKITQPVVTSPSTTALPQLLTPSENFIDQTPSSSPIVTSAPTITPRHNSSRMNGKKIPTIGNGSQQPEMITFGMFIMKPVSLSFPCWGKTPVLILFIQPGITTR